MSRSDDNVVVGVYEETIVFVTITVTITITITTAPGSDSCNEDNSQENPKGNMYVRKSCY